MSKKLKKKRKANKVNILSSAIAIFFGFASGVVIAGGVYAFIAIIGIVPRLAQKTGTQRYARWYEEVIMAGGLIGAIKECVDISMNVGSVVTAVLAFCGGVFFGCLAMSLAEVLDVMPVLSRRIRVQKGMFFFVLAIALGKLAGSVLYFAVPGFYTA